MKKTILVKSERQLDNAEREWKESIGRDPINCPARTVIRTARTVEVETVQDDKLSFVLEFDPERDNPCWGCKYRKSDERDSVNICLLDESKPCPRG